jgi:hypothetical protein
MSHRVKCYHDKPVLFWNKLADETVVPVVVHKSDGSRCDTRTLRTGSGVLAVGDTVTRSLFDLTRIKK